MVADDVVGLGVQLSSCLVVWLLYLKVACLLARSVLLVLRIANANWRTARTSLLGLPWSRCKSFGYLQSSALHNSLGTWSCKPAGWKQGSQPVGRAGFPSLALCPPLPARRLRWQARRSLARLRLAMRLPSCVLATLSLSLSRAPLLGRLLQYCLQ